MPAKKMQSHETAFFYSKCCLFNNLIMTRTPLRAPYFVAGRVVLPRVRKSSSIRMKPVVRGFTLFEVLVSILVLALGMLAAAGLQLSAIRTTQQSAIQTLAMGLASDLADRMRTNDVVMDLPDKANPFLAINFQSDQDLSEPGVYCNLASATCTPAQLAEFEIYEWQKRIKETLPSGRAVVCRDSNALDPVANSFKWACTGGNTLGSGAPFIIKVGWQGKNANGKLERIANGQFAPQIALIVAPYSK